MADEKQVSRLASLWTAATPALANYLNDHYSMLKFQAYLWKMIITVDHGRGSSSPPPLPGNIAAPDSAVGEMKLHG
jgi:hypothetical protein